MSAVAAGSFRLVRSMGCGLCRPGELPGPLFARFVALSCAAAAPISESSNVSTTNILRVLIYNRLRSTLQC